VSPAKSRGRVPAQRTRAHARTRASEPRHAQDLARLRDRYHPAALDPAPGADSFAQFAAAVDWLRALVKLSGRLPYPDEENRDWAEERLCDAVVYVSRICTELHDELAAEIAQP
jgi:hypothetical protein